MKVRQTLSDVVNRVNSQPRQSRTKTRRRASAISTGRQLQNGPHYGTNRTHNNAHGSKPYFKTSASCCSRTNCIGVSIWIGSLVFLTCGLVQFIAGAYFLTTLHVFHLGSNIWTGIWAVICALLSVYLYGSFTATSNATQSHPEPNTRPTKCRLSRRSRYYIIIVLAISMLLVNLVNLIVMEVLERPAAEHRKTHDYSESVFQTVRLACTGMTGTAIVTGLAIAILVYLTGLRNSDKRNITTLTDLPTKRRNQQRSGDWVFRMEDITSLEPKASSVSYNSERTATIRRAPSLLLTLSESSGLKTHLRKENRRNSLRMQGSRKLTRANVQRSQTMREFLQTSSAPSFTTSVRSVNFSSSTCDVKSGKKEGRYVRLSSKFDSLDSELAFMADNIESKTVTFTPSTSHSTLTANTSTDTGISSRPSSLEDDKTPSPSVTPESINPVVNPKQAPERIILRVESMKVPYRDKVMEAKWSRVRQCERTSSSTQTELSSLAGKSGIRHRPVVTSAIKKRPAPTRPITPPPTHIAYSTPTLALPGVSEPLPSLDFTEGTHSPTDSSSGYSSPHEENRSKMSTPEPAKSTKGPDKELRQASTPALPPLPAEVVHEPDGVTVIKIDTAHDSPWLSDSHQMYDIPRKLYAAPAQYSTRYGRDNIVPLLPRAARLNVDRLTREGEGQCPKSPDFQVRIRTNPAISRSVSFQHQRDNWRVKYDQRNRLAEVQHSASEQLRELPEEEFEDRPVTRKLARSSSVSVAMAEIERRLEYLRMHTKGHSYANSHAPSSEQSSLGTESSSLATTACMAQDYDTNRLEGQDLAEMIDHTETLAYLSELELLTRHWRSQLLYRQLDLKSKSQQFVRFGMQEAFEC